MGIEGEKGNCINRAIVCMDWENIVAGIVRDYKMQEITKLPVDQKYSAICKYSISRQLSKSFNIYPGITAPFPGMVISKPVHVL